MKNVKDSVFQIRLSNDLRNAIHETSNSYGVSSSSLVRDLLVDNMKQNYPQVCSKYSL
jgi:hypothetical protein